MNKNNVDLQQVPADAVAFFAGNQVVEYSITEAAIEELAIEYSRVPTDLAVKEDYAYCQKATAHLRGLRGDVERRRKSLKEDALKWGKLVDSTAKTITERLLVIETPLAVAKKDHDTALELAKREAALAEERRVDGIAERIARIKSTVEISISLSSEQVNISLFKILAERDGLHQWAMEFADKAEQAITQAVSKMQELYDMKLSQEQAAKIQAEAEAQRIREAEEARVKREEELEAERLRFVAETEKFKAEAEKLRKTAEELAEREAERAKIAAEIAAVEKAEAERVQKEKDDAAEAERVRMAAEIAALKATHEVKVVPVVQVEEVQEVKAKPADPSNAITDYKMTGRAMIQFIGSRENTKNLLDSIIQGNIPHLKYTGAI